MPRAVLALFAVVVACSGGSDTKDGASGSTPDEPETAAASAKACDLDEVAKLARGLPALDARARRDAVAKELGSVCELPMAIREYFEFVGPRDPNERKVARTPNLEALGKAKQAICPGAEVVFRRVADAKATDRARIIYDECKLDRYDLIRRREYLALGTLPVVPFFTFDWLQDQNVPEDQARPIVRAMLLLERHDWGRHDIEVPSLPHALRPVPRDAMVVYVTPTSIVFNEQTVVSLDGSGELSPLLTILADEADKSKMVAESAGRPYTGSVVIVAGADTPHSSFSKVLYTVKRADAGDVFVLAQNAPLEYGVVPVADTKDVRFGHVYGLRVEGKGFTADPFGTPRAIEDLEGLAQDVERFKRDNAVVDEALVGASDTATLASVVETIAALRGPECESTGQCLFDKVYFESRLPLMVRNFDPDLVGSENGPAKSIPRVRQAEASINGGLDKDIVRRIIRVHVNEVRRCYNQGLARDPSLEGRVTIAFTVGPTGKVTESKVESTTLDDEAVGTCTAKAVKRWKFPKPPGGGNAVVTYPFVLEPG